MDSHILTRESLYQQVWAEPMTHVAKAYGLSDRGLAKLCERHDIPVPPRGYWAKKAHGHVVPQTPMKPPSKPYLERIEIAPTAPQPSAVAADDAIPEIAFEQRPENRIVVAEHHRRFHRFVRQTREALRGQKPQDRGLLFPKGPCLDVRVSPAQLLRALRVMDALVLALEMRGYSPESADKGRGLFATVLGERLSITLTERSKRQTRRLMDFERRLGYDPSTYRPYDLMAAGILCLQIGHDWWRRNDLVETSKHPLEDSLNRFMIRLVKAALREKAEREQREQREREAAERERRRREAERVRQEQEKKERQWDEWMAAWTRVSRFESSLRSLSARSVQLSRTAISQTG